MGFSHTYRPDGPQDTLHSQGSFLSNGSHCGLLGRAYTPRSGEGVGASDCLGAAWKSPSSHILLLTSSKINQNLLSEVNPGTFAGTTEEESLFLSILG